MYFKAQLEVPQIMAVSGPGVGYTISSYIWDTSTPTPMYTDSAGGGSATSFTLSVLGQPQTTGGAAVDIFLDQSITYKFIVRDAAGGQVGPTIGPVTVGVASDFLVTASNTTRSRSLEDRFIDVVCVRDFTGYIADYDDDTGIGTNTASALQAAVDFLSARTTANHSRHKGAVYIPAGPHLLESALQVPYGVSIFGEGGTASMLFCKDCNGIEFITYGYSIGDMFFEDFGLTSVGADNYAGVVTAYNASTMDGLYLSRLRFYGWNEAIIFQSNWDCTIQNCVFENVNSCVVGSGSNGQCVRIKILYNRMSYAAGGRGTADPYGINFKSTSQFSESLHIIGNGIFGFQRSINIDEGLFVNIIDNDLSASVRVISLVEGTGTYNIQNNYIEVTADNGIGVFAGGLGSDPPAAKVNFKHNNLVGAASAGTIGLQLNESGNTYQFYWSIEDNMFYGFKSWDVLLYNPGRTLLQNNRLLSTDTTNSIYVGTVNASRAPITLRDNWCKKAIQFENLPDFAEGRVILQNNVENDVFQSRSRSAAPVDGTWRVGDIVYNGDPATTEYVGWVCTVAGTPGTWLGFGAIA